jgi:hypothetical protein
MKIFWKSNKEGTNESTTHTIPKGVVTLEKLFTYKISLNDYLM